MPKQPQPICSVCGHTYDRRDYLEHIRGNLHAAALAKPQSKPKAKRPGRR